MRYWIEVHTVDLTTDQVQTLSQFLKHGSVVILVSLQQSLSCIVYVIVHGRVIEVKVGLCV